ncbi:type VI secretion system baseplate subunit TssF [Alkalilimnicola sp. S0819]|uniref:type VI secretion system baseplate subunit TssF n=1 Tax=Alkalilimnicola sp. S0819 TaxID=2613922 RepID=UPI0012615960|nr:type VI secretion system baseplate subunit TssF [Alkalilimnicola sp. S0819]KAB7622592.1 type VI secretion system baseplate subunit TssF [Alkalilimnicola sp. S0819]MPQ17482.1 type VI secretion system baseplate subunit TssF [Alkalilimnicola sp. S0819]
MDDALLSYYNRELAYLRRQGAEFAQQHPRIAGHLRLDAHRVEDPHVSRLIESFALLSARLRHELDAGFPELTEGLLDVLHPESQLPLPSLAIVRLEPEVENSETHHLAAGTRFYTDDHPAARCEFRSCYPVDLPPLRVTAAHCQGLPCRAPSPPSPQGARASLAVLRLRLQSLGDTVLADSAPRRLRFFIHGQAQLGLRLHEYLLSRVTSVALARHPDDPDALFLPPDCLSPVGYSDVEAILPLDGRASDAQRLLTEFFAWPEKFLFVDLNLPTDAWAGLAQRAELYIHLDDAHEELLQGVDADTLQLGCTPIVNLFEADLEPLPAAELGFEARLSVDGGQQRWADIHRLLSLHAYDRDSRRLELLPCYGAHHGSENDAAPVYWQLRRELSEYYAGTPSAGCEHHLRLVDREGRLHDPDPHWVIGGQALCSNRDLPAKLPFGGGQPALDFLEQAAPLRVRCLTPPGPALRPPLDGASRRQLLGRLALQNFTGPGGLDTLCQTLALHDRRDSAETRALIRGITALEARTGSTRVRHQGHSAICQGIHLRLWVEQGQYSGAGLYLFSAVLSEFFARHCSINTYVQLSVHDEHTREALSEWPVRSGTQTLI